MKGTGPRIEYQEIGSLRAWEGNPKDHDLRVLEASIERFGYVKPFVIDEGTGRLVAGHGRLQTLWAMKEKGRPAPAGVREDGERWLAPVLRGIRWKDKREAEAFLLAANRIEEAGGWDDEALAKMLADAMRHGSIAGTGWSSEDVERMLVAQKQDLKKGLTPAERKEIYDAVDVKALTFYLTPKQHEQAERDMEAIQKDEEAEDRNAALLALLGYAGA